MAPSEFRTELQQLFDSLATDGCIGDPNGRPAYAYIRVSSDDQAEDGRSGLPRQLEHCHEIAAKRGYKISWRLVFADDYTGFEFEDRPALSRLRQDYKLPSRQAQAVIIEHLDRLSRNYDWHQGFLLDEMKQCSVVAVFWKAFTSRIERAVMGAIAQDGMEQAKERMREGNIRKAKRGRITAKVPSFGYKFVDEYGNEKTMEARRDTRYVIDEPRAVVVRYIYDAIARRGFSTYELIKVLDDRAAVDGRYKPVRSKVWSEKSLVNLIRRTVYKGEYVANRYYRERVIIQDERGHIKKIWRVYQRPREEWVIVHVPPIVDAETWELANKNLYRNKGFSKRNKVYEYLLSGLIRCATCGCRYHGQTQEPRPHRRIHHRQQRYYCAKLYATPAKRALYPCGQPSIKCDRLDAAVWGVIVGVMSNPTLLIEALDRQYNNDGVQAIRDQIAYLEQTIPEKATEETKLYQAYLAGAYTPEEYAGERRRVQRERETLVAEVHRLNGQIMTPAELEAKKRATIALIEEARQIVNVQEAPFALKQRIVRLLIDEVMLNTSEGWFEIRGEIGGAFFRREALVVSTSALLWPKNRPAARYAAQEAPPSVNDPEPVSRST